LRISSSLNIIDDNSILLPDQSQLNN